VKFTGAVEKRWHRAWFEFAVTVGIGFTVMVKKEESPVHVDPEPVKEGVTVMMAVTGLFVVLVAVNETMSPEPPAASPIEVFVFVQLYAVPGTAPENCTRFVWTLWHKTWFAVVLTVGMGFTVIVNEVGPPVHETALLVKVGVTVIVAVSGAIPVLTAVNAGIFPDPPAARPMAVLELTQL
jgi:hypothetical protein